MDTPKHLGHQPIISINDYDKFDAQYSRNSNAKALSIGRAYYDKEEISLKIWRHNGTKWLRSSEELPLHRNLDLSILLVTSILKRNNYDYPICSLREEIDEVSGVKEIQDYYIQNIKFLKPRLEELHEKLSELLNKK